MKHVYEKHGKCFAQVGAYCDVCDGGLQICIVCKCAEGSLATDCPGFDCQSSHGEAIYGGFIDYIDNAWVIGNQYKYVPGDVFQINETHKRAGWIGCFVLVTDIKSFGIQGFICGPETHEKQVRAYIRLPWEHIDYVGRAPLFSSDNHENKDAELALNSRE